jgi:predicted phage tail protein
MLLDFREVGGRYDLVPFITFGTVTHKALFTAGNIADGSFQYESVAPDDRLPVRVSVKWRQERSSVNPTNPGLFPEEREVLVREAAPYGSDALPMEAIDLSDFCTNENHAIDVAKFTLRMRRLRDHTIRFSTTYDGMEGITTGVGPGDLIRVAMDTTVYDQFNNGVVLADGTVISTTTLANGTYNVVSWSGTGNVNDAATLTVTNGIGSPAGIVFTVKQTTTQVRTYQISRITPTEDGVYDIEAVHMPTNSSGLLLVATDWDEASAWVIQR